MKLHIELDYNYKSIQAREDIIDDLTEIAEEYEADIYIDN